MRDVHRRGKQENIIDSPPLVEAAFFLSLSFNGNGFNVGDSKRIPSQH
jgi:hypothetical protein